MSLLCRFLRPLPVEAAPSLDTTGPLKAAHVCHLIHRWPALPWPFLPPFDLPLLWPLLQELELMIYNWLPYFTLKDSVMDPSYDGPDMW